MRIGDVADAAGTTVRAVRYYEEQGLLSSIRSVGGHRRFSEDTVARIRLIQRFLAAGLNSATIRAILPSVDKGVATADALELLRRHREHIAEQIAGLQETQERLDEVIRSADSPCDHSAASLPSPRRRGALGA